MQSFIPDHWTSEQALAVYDFLDELSQQLWARYQLELIPLLEPDFQPPQPHTLQLDLFESWDDLPF